MPTASRQVRKLRRLKRELTLAYRGMDLALKQRDQTRLIAGALETELKKYIGDPFPEGEDKTEILEAPKPNFTVKKLLDEEPIKDMINEGGPTHE